MSTLIIDTSTKYLYLCLVKDNKVIQEILEDGNKNHAPHSVLLIEEILKNNNININDLNEVVCGIGPGSYTGLRISLTIAKMICSFKNIPLKTISTLYLMSSAYEGRIVPVISARRENYFCGGYENNKSLFDEGVKTKEEIELIISDFKYIEEDMFKVNPIKVIENSKLESKVDEVVPNYLRITEAEYNLKKKNDQKM